MDGAAANDAPGPGAYTPKGLSGHSNRYKNVQGPSFGTSKRPPPYTGEFLCTSPSQRNASCGGDAVTEIMTSVCVTLQSSFDRNGREEAAVQCAKEVCTQRITAAGRRGRGREAPYLGALYFRIRKRGQHAMSHRHSKPWSKI
jgi:hypothetical protein